MVFDGFVTCVSLMVLGKVEPENKGNDMGWDVYFGVPKTSQIDQLLMAKGSKIVATIYSIYSH
jgi:hypothetical protein